MEGEGLSSQQPSLSVDGVETETPAYTEPEVGRGSFQDAQELPMPTPTKEDKKEKEKERAKEKEKEEAPLDTDVGKILALSVLHAQQQLGQGEDDNTRTTPPPAAGGRVSPVENRRFAPKVSWSEGRGG